jgi:SAM-dependent methyltransferase
VARALDSDVAVLERLLAPSGRDILDVGCGGGALVRALAARGARAAGLEIAEDRLAAARAADDGGARYAVGRADALPFADASLDAVVFMRSLHHVPVTEMAAALGEARRVLRSGGVVYVAEPLAEGEHFELMSIVEDELEVRAAAQRALEDCGRAGLRRARTVEYDVEARYDGLPALRARLVGVDPARASVFDANAAEIAAAFERLGSAGERPGERRFRQPMRADLLRPA